MEIQQYLRLMGRLYREGGRSGIRPDSLRRFGGSLAMVASDYHHIRIDPNSILGMERRIDDRRTAASIGWQRHYSKIQANINGGMSPTTAVFVHCAKFNTTPHRPGQLRQGLQQVMSSQGAQMSAWLLPTVEFRQRIQRGSTIMHDTFGAITTMAALAMTAEDWQHATPEEWDLALNVGEVGVVAGQLAGARHDARTQRQDTNRTASARTR